MLNSLRQRKILLAVVLICFLGGAGFGLWRNYQSRQAFKGATPLRVLCAESWLSEARLKAFSERVHVPIQYFTYARPSEFLRQMANADGKIDVVCASSFLIRGLIRNRWIKTMDYEELSNARAVMVDFMHLDFDPRAEFAVPLFWNLYGLLGPLTRPPPSLRQSLQNKKVALWGEELNILSLLMHSGVKIKEHIEDESDPALQNDVKNFMKNAAQIWNPDLQSQSPDELLDGAEWVEMPLSRAAKYLEPGSKYHFVLPEDGGAMELGLLAVGTKASQPRLAMQLINELLGSAEALELHQRLGAGVVQKTLDNVDTLPVWQRPQALRKFPLNRLRFPDLNIEVVPHFERLYDESLNSVGD